MICPPRRSIHCRLASRVIMDAASSRLGHADGTLDQRALRAGCPWSITDGSSRAGCPAPPAEIESPKDQSECREGRNFKAGEH